jgi:LysR family glycine cleavage system transcriptional activator
MPMTDTLPALAAIRVFEAAARLLSFTRAAAELGMTQAAVSYQIKLLEERLGATLFLRQPRALALTEAGQWLAPRTTEAFDILREAYARFAERQQGTLVVNTMHTFAAQWLAPRLGVYQLTHPKTAVQLETTQRVVDFSREEVDVVIRSGKGQWPGLIAHKLLDVRYTLMVSPALAKKVGGFKVPADMFKIELLDPGDIWWADWFKACGQPLEKLKSDTAVMGLQTITASAAIAGMGGALLVPEFFEQEIRDGRLMQPFDIVVDDGNAYWLAFPESRRNVPKIKAFRDWIVGEIQGGAPRGRAAAISG